ncbi:MAG: signal peptidase I [Oscillospiraceae bacterium]|nr:signal peptidase I [Oscillospiraceae bacterium]
METAKKIFKEWILPFGLEIIVLLVLLKFVFTFTVIPSGSMIPTIDEKSILFTTYIHNVEKLQRGDIVVFESEELDETLIKRLIGLPGETVIVDGEGRVTIDGVPLEEPYVVYPSDRSGEFHIPEGCYLFFGDNRRSSRDARMWDDPYIPADKIIAKAQFTLWPFQNFGMLN